MLLLSATMSTLAERLKAAREEKGAIWTQAHLGVVAGVSTGTVGNIESGARGRKKPPATLNQIAKALGVNYDWLAYGEEPKYPVSGTAHGALTFTGQATGVTAPPSAGLPHWAASYATMLDLVPTELRAAAFAESIRALHAYIPQRTPAAPAPLGQATTKSD